MVTSLPRQPMQARAQRTRNALLKAASAEFSRNGYAATTAKSIAARAEVATGSFYQYFPNKDALLRELARLRLGTIEAGALQLLPHPAEVCVASIDQGGQPMLRALASLVDLVILEHRIDPGVHAVLSERRHADPELDQLTSDYEGRLIERTTEWLRVWGSAGDLESLAFILFGMVEGAVHTHVLGRARVDDARFRSAMVDALLRVARPDLHTQISQPAPE